MSDHDPTARERLLAELANPTEWVSLAAGADEEHSLQLLDAYRAEVLREAADAVAEFTGSQRDSNVRMLRRRADGTPREGDPR